jgi:CubicO group peptidase (beta-lactamase class C family)
MPTPLSCIDACKTSGEGPCKLAAARIYMGIGRNQVGRARLLRGLISSLTVVFAAAGTDFSALENTVLDELQATHTPGAAIAIVSGDHVIFAKGFGVASAETGAAVTPDMLFRLGSTTKMFTAATLVRLAEAGKLDLNRPVGTYVKDVAPKLRGMTATQLLSHTAGLIDDAPMFGSHDDGALAANVGSWKDDYALTEPGRIFSYSNPGYVLAGYLAEITSGEPYADAVAERVLQPLGMVRSTFRPTVAMTYPLAQGHDNDGRVIRPAADYAGAWPAGSLFSSVNELSRFVIAFLNDGRADGKTVLQPSVIARLSTPVVTVPGGEVRYGLGLEQRESHGVKWIEHAGNRTGYGSLIRMAPERRFGMIILGNKSGASLPKSADKAAELVLGLVPALAPKPKTFVSMTEAELHGYAGKYRNHNDGPEILLKEGRLLARADGKEQVIGKSADGRLFMQGSDQVEIIPVPAHGPPEFLFMGFRAFKRVTD